MQADDCPNQTLDDLYVEDYFETMGAVIIPEINLLLDAHNQDDIKSDDVGKVC